MHNILVTVASSKLLKQVVKEKQKSNRGAEGGRRGWMEEMKEEESI